MRGKFIIKTAIAFLSLVIPNMAKKVVRSLAAFPVVPSGEAVECVPILEDKRKFFFMSPYWIGIVSLDPKNMRIVNQAQHDPTGEYLELFRSNQAIIISNNSALVAYTDYTLQAGGFYLIDLTTLSVKTYYNARAVTRAIGKPLKTNFAYFTDVNGEMFLFDLGQEQIIRNQLPQRPGPFIYNNYESVPLTPHFLVINQQIDGLFLDDYTTFQTTWIGNSNSIPLRPTRGYSSSMKNYEVIVMGEFEGMRLLEFDFVRGLMLNTVETGLIGGDLKYLSFLGGSEILIIYCWTGARILFHDFSNNTPLSNSQDIYFTGYVLTLCVNRNDFVIAGKTGGYFESFIVVKEPVCARKGCAECRFKENYCVKCFEPYFLSNGTCVQNCDWKIHQLDSEYNECRLKKCSEGEYFDGVDCQVCEDQNCETCSKEKCFLCREGSELISGECINVEEKKCPFDSISSEGGDCITIGSIPDGFGIDWDNGNVTKPCRESFCKKCAPNYLRCLDVRNETGLDQFQEESMEINFKLEKYLQPVAEAALTFVSALFPGINGDLDGSMKAKMELAVIRLINADMGSKPDNLLEKTAGAFGLFKNEKNLMENSRRVSTRFVRF